MDEVKTTDYEKSYKNILMELEGKTYYDATKLLASIKERIESHYILVIPPSRAQKDA